MSLPQMSAAGGVMILAIVVIRALALERLPKRTFTALWALVLARLLLPFSLPSPLSVYSLLGRRTAVGAAGTAPIPDLPLSVPAAGTAGGLEAAASSAPPFPLWAAVWAGGTVLLAVAMAVLYWRCRREFAAALPVEDPLAYQLLADCRLRRPAVLRQSDRVSTPLTYGLLRPVILLPKTMDFSDREALRYVLAHEAVHIRRMDGAAKLVLAAALCLHWCNPLVWAMYVLANRDIELSCDEAVVRLFGREARAAYARTLIRMEEDRSRRAILFSHFSKNAIEERIVSIMKTRKTSLPSALLAAALIVCVAGGFATSAAASEAQTAGASASETAQDSAFDPASLLPASRADFEEEGDLLRQYETFGVSYDEDGRFYYQGQRVRYFRDSVDVLEDGRVIGWAVRYEYLDQEGVIDVYTQRDAVYDDAGDMSLAGPIAGMRVSTREEFDALDVAALLDPERVAAESADSTATTAASAKPAASAAESDVVLGGGDGRAFSEIFSQYQAYGLVYEEAEGASGAGGLYYNGQPVASFTDVAPDGGVFTFQAQAADGLHVRTVYDSAGRLTGVAAGE